MQFPSDEEIERWRMALADEQLFGKNDAVFELRLPSDLKDALAQKGAETGRSLAAVLRLAAVLYLRGPEHVAMVVARRYGLAQQSAPSVVPTNVVWPFGERRTSGQR